MKILFILFILFSCNPFNSFSEIELWICITPTLHIKYNVNKEKINLDTIKKYFEVDEEHYKIYLDTLKITQNGNIVSIYAIYGDLKYKESFRVYNNIPYIFKDDILIYLLFNI